MTTRIFSLLQLYEYLKRGFDPHKVQFNQNRIYYEVIGPFQVDCEEIWDFLRQRFKAILEETQKENLQVRMSISSQLPLIIEEKVTKKLEAWSCGDIILHLVKNRQEVEHIANLLGLDITPADFPPLGHCMTRRCGERGYERWTFDKRRTHTKLETFEENIKSLIEKHDFSVLQVRSITLGTVRKFFVEYDELRSLYIKPADMKTTIRVSVTDLFSKNEDILLAFDWLTNRSLNFN